MQRMREIWKNKQIETKVELAKYFFFFDQSTKVCIFTQCPYPVPDLSHVVRNGRKLTLFCTESTVLTIGRLSKVCCVAIYKKIYKWSNSKCISEMNHIESIDFIRDLATSTWFVSFPTHRNILEANWRYYCWWFGHTICCSMFANW